MRTYETIFIVHPDTAGEAYTAVVDKFRNILTEQNAKLIKVEEWGSRKLAYPVKKQTRGTYVLVAYEAGSTVIAEFERRMRIDESIIKFQTVHLEKGLEVAAAPAAAPVEAPAETEGDAGAEETEEA